MPRKRASTPVIDIRNRVTELRYVRPADLADHPQQWRIHGEQQQQAMRGILREIGIAGALLAYESPTTGQLTSIDGHLRKSLADQPWPTLILDLTDEEARLLLASYDPISAMAESNRVQLEALLADVHAGDAQVQQFLAQLRETQGLDALTDHTPLADVEPEVDRAEELRHQYGVDPGHLWQCGVHRLLCADALIPANLERLLAGDTPQLIWADPPYGLNIVQTNGYGGGGEAYDIPFGGRKKGQVGGGEAYRARHGEWAIQRDKRKGQGGTHQSNIVEVGKYAPVIGDDTPQTARQASAFYLNRYPHAVHVWWGGNYYADHLPASMGWLIWNKEISGNFSDAELAWTNQQRAVRLFTHRWNGMLRASEHERRWHPTQKPAALAAWAFDLLGEEGDLVLDPFLGCGPALIAAAQTGRRCYGIELSPEYVAVSLHRWATLTGQTPHLVDG